MPRANFQFFALFFAMSRTASFLLLLAGMPFLHTIATTSHIVSMLLTVSATALEPLFSPPSSHFNDGTITELAEDPFEKVATGKKEVISH